MQSLNTNQTYIRLFHTAKKHKIYKNDKKFQKKIKNFRDLKLILKCDKKNSEIKFKIGVRHRGFSCIAVTIGRIGVHAGKTVCKNIENKAIETRFTAF